MKLLSIVIPMYNVERYLERCLNSLVFNENILSDLELIIVNDGSRDKSLEIARKYKKKYPNSIVIIDKENGGHGSTINAGLKIATGKYFRVIDSDDWVGIDGFCGYVEELKHCDQDIVLTNFRKELLYTGESIEFKYKAFEYNKTYNLDKFDYSKLGLDYFFMTTTTFKTSKLKEANLILDEKTFYVDMEFVLLPILNMKNLVYLNHDVYRYFIGRPEQSVSIQSYVRNRKHHEKVVKRLLKFYGEIDKKNKQIDYVAMVICQLLDSHYTIYCKAQLNSRKDINEIRAFNLYLKKYFPEIFLKIRNKYRYIKWNQMTNFVFCQFGNNFLSKLAYKMDCREKKGSDL